MEDGLLAVACLSLADGRIPQEITGPWLVRYDPEGYNSTSDAVWSHDPADAATFTARRSGWRSTRPRQSAALGGQTAS
jgi:hypothetical protein